MNAGKVPGSGLLVDTTGDANLKVREMDLNAGLLGRFFGIGPRAAMNGVLLIVLLTVLGGLVFSFTAPDKALEFWKTVGLPIVTTGLGFAAGKASR